MMKERLQKILSEAGVASRRKAEQMILSGDVTVNGEVIRELGRKFTASQCDIRVKGRKVEPETEKIYLLLNKPKGYISTLSDERGRKTVIDLLPDIEVRVYPIGRLDNATEGLLLLTNDGALTNGLLHPRYEIKRTYLAKVTGEVTEEKLDRLRAGITLDDGIAAPAKVRLLSAEGAFTRLEITISEGRNREVRRMFAALGCDVKALKRTNFAGLSLSGVKRGHYRHLTAGEVEALYAIVNTPSR